MPRYPERLVQLERLLHEGHELSLGDICEQLKMSSTRHARRLIRQLQAHDVPVQERRIGRLKYFFLDAAHRKIATQDLAFDEEEMLALAVAAEAAKAALTETPLGDPLERAFCHLIDKLAPEALMFELEEQSGRWHFGDQVVNHFDPEVFRVIQEAINDNCSVRIDYQTASTNTLSKDRKIDPLQLVRYRGTWAVVAWCHLRQDFRDFALSGIKQVVPCDPAQEMARFSPPASYDPETYFQNRFGALAGDDIHTVRLLVAPDREPYFQRKQYHPSQRITKRSDGRMVVSYEVAGLHEVRSFAQSWGVGVTVLEPPELVAMMADEAAIIAKRYAQASTND